MALGSCRATTKFGNIGKSQVYKKQVHQLLWLSSVQPRSCLISAAVCMFGLLQRCQIHDALAMHLCSLTCRRSACNLACGPTSRSTCSSQKSQGAPAASRRLHLHHIRLFTRFATLLVPATNATMQHRQQGMT